MEEAGRQEGRDGLAAIVGDGEPPLLVAADPSAAASVLRTAARAGPRVGAVAPLPEGAARLSRQLAGAALSHASIPERVVLNDVGKGQATARLQQLSEEVGRIASILAGLAEDDAIIAAAAAAEPAEEGDDTPLDAAEIRAMIRVRRLRDHFFNKELFADPAWDMMLDLMAARLERQRVAVSSLCIAAAVPPTTALRWIKALCDQGLFVRVADPEDGRRVFIELSDDAAQRLEAFLKAALRVSPAAI